MVFLLLGAATLLVLMLALGGFSRAQIATFKQLGLWVVAIGGLLLATLLFVAGRGVPAIAALVILGPLVWSWIAEGKRRPAPLAGRQPMSRVEALAVLGLTAGATEADVRAAHRRLMQMAHPDRGGSDWLASRINQARDVLLG